MRNVQDSFETRSRSFISAFSICMTVLLMNEKDFGLYRDHGLGILRNTSRPKGDRKRKNIIKILKEYGLCITCEVNKKIVDFLDVQFNLNDQIY